MGDGEVTARDDEHVFPRGATLHDGRYVLVEHYLGGGIDQLWFARDAADASARYLVSTTYDNGFKLDSDGPPLMRPAGILCAPRFLGAYDLIGDGGAGDQRRRFSLGYVEQVAGTPLARVGIDISAHAFRISAQIAEVLITAAATGVLVVGLRPEYVWIDEHGDEPRVSAIAGRNLHFFGAARRRRDLPTAPLFTRRYVAPEVYRGAPYDDRALVLTLALITTEWLLGRYPYEDDDAYGYLHLCRGEHVPLPPAAAELAPALSPDPAGRPDLASFTRTLRRLAR
jgi:hypothetical protein